MSERVFARRLIRAIFCLLIVAALFAAPGPAAAAGVGDRSLLARSWVDRRIDAIPATALLHADPRSLADQGRAEASRRLVAIRRPLFFGWALAQIGVLFWLWRSGSAARLREALTRRLRGRVAIRAAYVVVLALLVELVAVPFSAFGYRTAVAVGISRQPLLSWIHDVALSTAIEALTAAVIVVVVLEFVDRTRLWYLYASAFFVVFGVAMLFIQPIVLAPLFNHYTLVEPQSTIGRELYAVERLAGAGSVPIFIDDLSRQSDVGNANVAGVGATKRVVIGDTLLRTATLAEVSFVMAHELGHDRRGDAFALTLFGDALFILGVAFAILTADRFRLRGDDDALSRLALIGALLGCFALVLFPIYNAYSRAIEARADRFGLSVTHDGVAGSRMFLRFADEGFAPVCPPRLVRLYFYDHPPVGSRIAALTDRPDPCP